MSGLHLAAARIRFAGDEQFQKQVASLMDAVTDLPAAYPKRRTWDKAVARLNAEVAAMNKRLIASPSPAGGCCLVHLADASQGSGPFPGPGEPGPGGQTAPPTTAPRS